MNTIFKVGDRVYDWNYGWGEVYKISESGDYPIFVDFKDGKSIATFTMEGYELEKQLIPTLSFTEYDFVKGGFSQERPKPKLPEIDEGSVAYFGTYYHRPYDPYFDEGIEWKVGYFVKMANGRVTFKMSKDAKLPSIAVLFALENPLINPDTPIYKAEDYI